MTNNEIIQLIQTDPAYALKFALDNNYAAIRERLAEKGYIVESPAQAFVMVMELRQLGKADVIRYAFDVPYLDSAENGTGGLRDFFVANSAPPAAPQGGKSFNWAGLLTTVGIVLTGAGVAIGSTNTTGGTATTETPEQKAAREAAEAAAEKKKKIILWSCIGAGILVAGIVLYFVFREKPAK